MLPEITLDRMEFQDIVKKTRSELGGMYPEWTNFNAHDPGMTLIELFAYLKEAQQFYMDQIGEDTIRKFTQLLGITPLNRKPAETLGALEPVWEPEESCRQVPACTRFYLGDICCETIRPETVPNCQIRALMAQETDGHIFTMDTAGERLEFYPFGIHP